MRHPLVLALLASAALPAAAAAQDVTAGGSIQGRLGYGDNPFLQLNAPGGTAVAGASLTGWLQRRSEVSTTRLTGVASLDPYFSHYGTAENYLATLEHQQTLSERLVLSGKVSYQDSINPRDFSQLGGTNVDLLSVGQRSRTLSADGTAQWSPTARDSFYIGPEYMRATYPRQSLNDFEQYGLRGGYLRQINETLSAGIDLRVQKVNSQGFSDSTSYQASLRLTYDINPIWRFDGTAGLIRQSSDFGGSSSTPGFTAQLCGKYPRYRVCVEGSRQSAASGFGGLRTDNRARASLDYDLSTRSHLVFAAVYNVSESRGFSIVPKQKYWEVSSGYTRTLTERFAAGVSGRYQYRDYGNFAGVADSSVTGYSATVDVTYKFGRLE